MSTKITYSRLNAYSIVLAALLLERNAGAEVKVHKKHKVTAKQQEENAKVIAKNHVLHLISDEALLADDNESGKKIAIAIIGLHGDLTVAANVALLTQTNNADLKVRNQLENEGALLISYEDFKDDFGGSFVDELTEEPEDDESDTPVVPISQPPVAGQNGEPVPGDDGKKVKLGTEGDDSQDGTEQHEEPIVEPTNDSTNAPEQNMAPIVGSDQDGQKSTDLSNEVEEPGSDPAPDADTDPAAPDTPAPAAPETPEPAAE